MATFNESSDLDARINEVRDTLKALAADVAQDEESRKKLLAVAQESTAGLETPLEFIWRIIMQPHQLTSLKIAIDMRLVELLVKNEEPMTATELARATGYEKLLIIRILRPLAATGVFKEVDLETYVAAPISMTLMAPPLMGGYQFMYDAAAKSLAKMPEFIAQTGFKNPTGPTSPFNYALNTDLPLWPWLLQNPALLNHFNSFMTGQRMHRKDWFEFAPVDKLLLEGFKDGVNPLLVDIGGGRGHCLEAFKSHFPDASGQLILQELPETINDISELHEDIVKIPHDFFTPQPVKGARVYYFRSIFHDWSDDKACEILRHTAAAMTKGYSRLLIFEWVLPNVGVPLYPALLDINMMTLFSGMERTETQWKELLGSVGLEVVKFWGIGKDTEGLIEAVLKD